MKIRFLATGIAPKQYEFKGETIVIDDKTYDLSVFDEGDIFEWVEGDIQSIRAVKRIDGELYVTLCQQAPQGHWRGIDEWIDSSEYDPDAMYIQQITSDCAMQERDSIMPDTQPEPKFVIKKISDEHKEEYND